MLFSFFQIGFWFLWAFASAALEVNSEGTHGWASALPTPRREDGGIGFRLLRLVTGGRPVTGYHLSMFTLQFMATHAGYAFGQPFTWQAECLNLAIFLAVCATWDFLWFVLNPAYGLKRFKKELVPWHASRWWVAGKFPVDYLLAAVASFALMVAAQWPLDVISGIGLPGVYYLWGMCILITVETIGPWYRRRRVRLLAGNDPPIIETNVDEERCEDVDDDMIEEEKTDSPESG